MPAPKILVQDKNSGYWLISEDAIPVQVPSDSNLLDVVNRMNHELETYFTSFNPPGVKFGITIVDF